MCVRINKIDPSFIYTNKKDAEKKTRMTNHAPVVRRLNNAIHRINCYPVDTEVLKLKKKKKEKRKNTLSARWCFIQWIALSTFRKSRAKCTNRSASIVKSYIKVPVVDLIFRFFDRPVARGGENFLPVCQSGPFLNSVEFI